VNMQSVNSKMNRCDFIGVWIDLYVSKITNLFCIKENILIAIKQYN